MYAILKHGGHQYRVAAGDRLLVDRLAADIGARVTLEPVLLVADGDRADVGAGGVPGARVTATVVAHRRGRKLRVFTYKPKKRHRRTLGYRSQLTELIVEEVATATGSSKRADKPAAAKPSPPKAAAPKAAVPRAPAKTPATAAAEAPAEPATATAEAPGEPAAEKAAPRRSRRAQPAKAAAGAPAPEAGADEGSSESELAAAAAAEAEEPKPKRSTRTRRKPDGS